MHTCFHNARYLSFIYLTPSSMIQSIQIHGNISFVGKLETL